MSQTTPGSWQPDPYGRFAQRYWDGANWTENVIDASGGQTTDSPVPSAGAAFGAAKTSGSALPVPGLVVAGIGVVLVLLSLFVLNWYDLSSEEDAEFRSQAADLTESERRAFETEVGVSIDGFLDGIKLSETRNIIDTGRAGDPAFLEEQYIKWGYLIAIAAAAFAVAALFVKNLRFPALAVVIVMLVWHAGVSYSLGSDESPTAIGAWLGAVGLAACAVALFLPRPQTAA